MAKKTNFTKISMLATVIFILPLIYLGFEMKVSEYRDNRCTAETKNFTGRVDPLSGEDTISQNYITKNYYEYWKCNNAFPIKTPLLNFY